MPPLDLLVTYVELNMGCYFIFIFFLFLIMSMMAILFLFYFYFYSYSCFILFLFYFILIFLICCCLLGDWTMCLDGWMRTRGFPARVLDAAAGLQGTSHQVPPLVDRLVELWVWEGGLNELNGLNG